MTGAEAGAEAGAVVALEPVGSGAMNGNPHRTGSGRWEHSAKYQYAAQWSAHHTSGLE